MGCELKTYLRIILARFAHTAMIGVIIGALAGMKDADGPALNALLLAVLLIGVAGVPLAIRDCWQYSRLREQGRA